MAFSAVETELGSAHDMCKGPKDCNGIGLAQIITALDANGVGFPDSDPRWVGITHNVLTNLTYGTRVLAEKIRETNPPNLVDLARKYNGNSDPKINVPYGPAVESRYKDIAKCF